MHAIALLLIAMLIATPASSDLYFNSSEPGCDIDGGGNPSNSDYLWCDDVENANGFIETCSSPGQPCCLQIQECLDNGAGTNNPDNDGWRGQAGYGLSSGPGTIGWPDAQGGSDINFQRCGSKGAGGTDCTGTSGLFTMSCGANGSFGVFSRHNLHQDVEYGANDEIYMRFYRRHATALEYYPNNQKWGMMENSSGNAVSGILKHGGPGYLAMTQAHSDTQEPHGLGCTNTHGGGAGQCTTDHPANISQAVRGDAPTNWWYIEWHVKIGTSNTHGSCDGVMKIWADDCGVRGDACPPTPTLRSHYTDMCWRYGHDITGVNIRTMWFETWGNAGDCGEEHIDQFIASRSFVGPMDQSCDDAGDCDDSNPCTDDSCVDSACVNTNNTDSCDDGVSCTENETCSGGSCQSGTPNDSLCDDSAYCNGDETCHVTLDCQAGTPPDCDDGVGCTDDSCNEGTDSCDNVTNDAKCDDSLFCNGAETCHVTLDCQAGSDPCPGQMCHEDDDTCHAVTNDPDMMHKLMSSPGGSDSRGPIKDGYVGYVSFSEDQSTSTFNVDAAVADVCMLPDTASTSGTATAVIRRVISGATEEGSMAYMTLTNYECKPATHGEYYMVIDHTAGSGLISVTGRK